MTNKGTEPSQAEGVALSSAPADNFCHFQSQYRGGNKVYKSGPLFLSSRGIGWTSWKKRWFILTCNSLVFFRSDPNAVSQKGNDVNLTLGGIDLNSSGSVVVKEDKKLLTVLFAHGNESRAFTLKAETLEDLLEWKAALEEALSKAPSAVPVLEQNEIVKENKTDDSDTFLEKSKDRHLPKSLVIGRPILLALEDIDGNPSFLEKGLRFLEEYGVEVEGILRQAADVDDVERRIQDYEQGMNEFSAGEDAHIIADCVKYILRELPSSPVPASCCNALLEAWRVDRSVRVNTMRTAICETFPEPNRRLLQRILMMMQAVVSNKSTNRMSSSAVAACMAPLLLRPLLSGDCELDHDFDMGGDGSIQLMQAAAAANHAQAIVITLLDEYDNIFGEESSVSSGLYSDSEYSEDDVTEDDEDYYASEGSEEDIDGRCEHPLSGSCSENSDAEENHRHDQKSSESSSPVSESHETDNSLGTDQIPAKTAVTQQSGEEHTENIHSSGTVLVINSRDLSIDNNVKPSLTHELNGKGLSVSTTKTSTGLSRPVSSLRQPTVWGRTSARKNLSMEANEPFKNESQIEGLEVAKAELQNQLEEQIKGKAKLPEDLEKRKNDLKKLRLVLEQDVARLQEQLQREQELKLLLEAEIKFPQGVISISAYIDEKTKADLAEIEQTEADIVNLKEKVNDLGLQLKIVRDQNYSLRNDLCNQPQQTQNHHGIGKDRQKNCEKVAACSTIEPASCKDACMEQTKCETDEPANFPNKVSHQKQLSESGCHSKASIESGTSKPATSNSKTAGAWGERANSTTYALSRLTNRLNFLKERRSQIATELHNIEKARTSGQSIQNPHQFKGLESRPPHQKTEKFQGSGGQSSEKNRASDSHKPQKGFSDSEEHNDPDKKKRSEEMGNTRIEKRKSEISRGKDKDQSSVTRRTFSR